MITEPSVQRRLDVADPVRATQELKSMCDFSLHAIRSRPAKIGDKLTTHNFNWATTGFCAPEDSGVAVCLVPGTEVSFADQVRLRSKWPWTRAELSYKTAIFRQSNKAHPNTHHDALEFPDGQIVLLTNLAEGQQATVLQLPARAASMKAKEEPAVDDFANADGR